MKQGRRKFSREDAERLGENIRRERAILNWTQAELGKRSGISQKMISNFERGIAVPDAFTIQNIATALETTVEELVKKPH